MALDPKGAHGVSRAPMPALDAPLCILCGDGGLHRHTGEWNFCGCPSGVSRRIAEPGLADESNAILARLEERTKRK